MRTVRPDGSCGRWSDSRSCSLRIPKAKGLLGYHLDLALLFRSFSLGPLHLDFALCLAVLLFARRCLWPAAPPGGAGPCGVEVTVVIP
jgi:hypothetical protein